MKRREFLAATGSLGLSVLLGGSSHSAPSRSAANKFRFVHFTDLHIQPELGAAEGVRMAVGKLLAMKLRPDFLITGGDHVMDVLNVSRERADLQFKLLGEALKPLEMPVYSAVGNHDVYGWSQSDAATEKDPQYGKQMFSDRVAKGMPYRSFDANGWHFIILDSIAMVPPHGWRAEIEDAQLQWLKNDLEKTGKQTPMVIVSHCPMITAFTQYHQASTAATTDSTIVRNGKEVRGLFKDYQVRAVLQGHTHIVEEIVYTGTRFITSGAVCGDWWKGPRLGVHPEGFAVFDVDGDKLAWQYETYGWKARTA